MKTEMELKILILRLINCCFLIYPFYYLKTFNVIIIYFFIFLLVMVYDLSRQFISNPFFPLAIKKIKPIDIIIHDIGKVKVYSGFLN